MSQHDPQDIHAAVLTRGTNAVVLIRGRYGS